MLNQFYFADIISRNHSFLYIFHFLLVVGIILLLAKFSVKRMKLIPSGLQNIMEAYLLAVESLGTGVFESKELARKHLPLVATIGMVVFFGNMLGIIPGFESPTASLNLTVALALVLFAYYNYQGIKEKGVLAYFKEFAGPTLALAPLMFVIEIVSHFSRIISLSFRLFGNIKGDDLFLIVILTLVPFVVPLVPFGLLFIMGILQAFVFMMLAFVYLAGAVQGHAEH